MRRSAAYLLRLPMLGRGARSISIAAPALLLIGVLTWPLCFSSYAGMADWPLHLWFMWKQSLNIQSGHFLSLFLNYPNGVFYPQYAFYGGTLEALTGVISLLLGNAPIETYVLAYVLGFAAAYGGWYWLARISGLGRWWAHAPGLVFITSSYYLTLIYARADWPEFMGVSMIPLLIASGLSVLRAERLRAGPGVLLLLSSTIYFGSHSLTVAWASTLMAVVGLALVLCVSQARRAITWRGVLRVGCLVIPALMLSAWFLVPALAYESSTHIASEYSIWREVLQNTMGLVSFQHLFTLSRASASTPGTDFALSLPILTMGWTLVNLVLVCGRGLRGAWPKVLLICAVMSSLLIVLMTNASLILMLPRIYSTLQFSYRLESYVLLALSGAVLAILVLAQDRDRTVLSRMRWLLLPILAVGVVGAIQQTGAYPHSEDRARLFAQLYRSRVPVEYALIDYLDSSQPVLSVGKAHPAQVDFNTATSSSTLSATVRAHPGSLVLSNLLGPPPLVHVSGARIVGIDSAEGDDVLEVTSSAGSGSQLASHTVVVSAASPFPVVLGRVLTVCALVWLVGMLALGVRRQLRGSGPRVGARRSGAEPSVDERHGDPVAGLQAGVDRGS